MVYRYKGNVWECIGGVCVYEKEDYRKMIIEMVNSIKSCDILVYIYKLTLDISKEDKKDGEE